MIYSILSIKNNSEKLNTLLAGMKGILGTDLYSVSVDEISVIVSDINRNELIAERSVAIEYAGILETLAQQFTLLPVRFGSFMDSTDAIIKMAGRNYREIQQNLNKVENKIEFGLKVLCDSEKLKSDLRLKAEAGTKVPDKPAVEINNSVYRDWVDKKLKEHRLEELLLTYVNEVITVITGSLDQLNAVNKFKKMVTEKTIIDAVFLLHKEQKDTVIKITEELQNRYPVLNFVLTGPWPPYNFVDITIK